MNICFLFSFTLFPGFPGQGVETVAEVYDAITGQHVACGIGDAVGAYAARLVVLLLQDVKHP